MTQFAALRTMVGRFLVDTCTIGSETAPVFDTETGEYDESTDGVVYRGTCRVRPAGGGRGAAKGVEAGDVIRTIGMYDVTLPWDTTGIEIGHVVTITRTEDPHMIARQLRVIDVQGGSDGPYRRLVAEDTLTTEAG